jgi:hypothetical protein
LKNELSQTGFLSIIRLLNEKSRKTLDLLDTTLLWHDHHTSEMKKKDFIPSIKDTGSGLTDQQLKKLQTLQILSSVGTNDEKGFGIGLELCSPAC